MAGLQAIFMADVIKEEELLRFSEAARTSSQVALLLCLGRLMAIAKKTVKPLYSLSQAA